MTGNQEAFQKVMNLGHSAAWEQQWDHAAAYYRQALEEMPDNPMALTSLGLALFELQEFDGALRIYQRAAVVSPSDPISFEKVAHILERKGKTTEAVQFYMQAADLQLRARDIDKAVESWTRVLALQENLVARTRLALVFERMGHKADAISEYIAAASVLQQTGDLAKAMKMAEYAQQLMPDSLDAQQALTLLRTNQHLPKPPRPRSDTGPIEVNDARQLPAPGPDSPSKLDPIQEARQKAMVQLAALLFDQAEEVTPTGQVSRRGISDLTRGNGGLSPQNSERTRILLHLGQAIDSLTQGNEAQAAEELERALDIGLKSPAPYFALGLLNANRDSQKALRFLQQSVKHPDFVLASFLLMGKTHQKEGRLTEAITMFIQALAMCDIETVSPDQAEDLQQIYEPFIESQSREVDPKILNNNCDSIATQLIRPDWRQYLLLARQQLPPQPPGLPPLPLAEILLETRNSQVLERMAHIRTLAGMNKLTSAMEEAFSTLEVAPSYLPLQIQIGDLLLKEGRTQDAVDKFLLIANLYNLRGEAAQAIRMYRRIIQIAPMDLTVRTKMIELLIAQGRSEDAVLEYINLGELYNSLVELDLARQSYSTGLKVAQQGHLKNSSSIPMLYKIADIDLQRLDLRSALRGFEQIRNLNPEDENARGRIVDLTFRMSQENAALDEIDGFISLMENKGKPKEILDFLKEILNDRPEKMEVRKRLADQYLHARQIPQAIEQFDIIANALMNSGNGAVALPFIQTIISLRPANVADYERVLAQLQK
ncbi:MAG TPA: tetratricopeptide repeat protein [Anaerolineaceae bacterium]